MKYPRNHQHALGVAQPVSVLWAALKAVLPAEEVRKVEAAYKAQSRRYSRACELNKMGRWVERVERYPYPLDTLTAEKLVKRRAILAEPHKYVEGE